MPKEILKDIIDSFTSEKLVTFFRRKSTNFRQAREEYTDVSREQFRDVAKIGEIKFADTSESKLIVVTARVLKSLSERSGKKAQYDLGKKMIAAGYYDVGIFVFYDTQGSFRFSLIYPQYVGHRKQWSNFRRFTYFVSPELTNKTFLTRVGDGDFSSLDKIKDAFSVEKVTKEFYEQYRKLFEALVADLNKNRAFQMVASKNQINTSDFSKKTLGQIVFLYFLQKKGWLGVPQNKPWGEGNKNFISNLYKQAVTKSENFYNDYLEILFYDTLNNASREGADPSFSKYFNCRIPFLNGGLFEPEYDWKKTIINLENTIFNNIFEVFDRYNFTVEEESPDDKEVAVDPEMLGKVFENLLEENLRKGKGTYYTPREIVHYMCRESLINHLIAETKIDEKLIRNLVTYKDITPEDIAEAMDNPEARHRMADRSPTYWLGQDDVLIEKALSSVKVCDPACGSGAFLVGMLNEIVSVRRLLNPGTSEYQMKKEIIENCIYGVDIDPGAVEIAKLRLWLSLVVDYELADIEPLPNLDYKIMCGNSLLEELIVGDESIELVDPRLLEKDKPKRKVSDKVMQMDLFDQDAEKYLGTLRKLHIEYFHETDAESKKNLRGKIEKIELDFIQASINKRVKEIETQIKNLNMQKPEDRKKNAVLMKRKLEYMAIPSDIRKSKVRPYFLWHLNFFEVFQEKSGFDVVLGNPPWGQKSVKFLDSEKKYYKKVYPSSTVGILDIFRLFIERSIMILAPSGSFANVLPDIVLLKNYDSTRKLILDNLHITHIDHWGMAFESVNLDSCTLIGRKKSSSKCASDNSVVCTVHTPQESIKNNIPQSRFLETDGYKFNLYLNAEIIALINKLKNEKKFGDFYEPHEGIHSGNIRQKLFVDHKMNHNSKKLILGRGEVSRYHLAWGGKWVNYDRTIINKSKGEYAGLGKPEYFEKLKIIVRRTGDYILAALDENEYYFSNNMFVCIPKHGVSIDLKYVLGVLNSKLATWFYRTIQPRKGKLFAELKINVLEKIPIKETSADREKLITELVDQILEMKRDNPDVDTSRLEDKIDGLVYDIFTLTNGERQVIERAFSRDNEDSRDLDVQPANAILDYRN